MLDKLNESQRKAVTDFSSNLLVIAGAGSGKTTVITEKINLLITNYDIEPNRILAITFTNKAADEMKYRIYQKTGKKLDYIMTFHSFALNILKTDPKSVGLDERFVVYDDFDQEKIIKDLKKKMRVDYPIQKIISAISLHKEGKKKIEDPVMKEIYRKYQETLIEHNAIDFDDILRYAVDLLKIHEDYRTFWKHSFDYILIDEFQDTNRTQLELVKLLYQPNSLMVVGDPNQTIYSWRGAEISNILNFAKEFDAKIIKLETNYRSQSSILHFANALMKGHMPEEVIPILRPSRGKGPAPVIKSFKSDTEEAEKIAQTIKYMVEKHGYQYQDIAVLIRNNFLAAEIERKLIEHKIPYKILAKTRFQDRFEIKLILSYLRFALNPKDPISFEYCINNPTRGIGKKTLQKLEEMYEKDWIYTIEKNINEFKDKQKKGFKEFLNLIKKIQKKIDKNDLKIIEFISKEIDIKEILNKRYKHKQQVTKKLNAVEALSKMIKETKDVVDVINNLTPDKEDEINKENKVIISTVHSAKGLEYPVVFIPALEDGIYPRLNATDEEREEERRVLYVAMTRAKDWLFMSYANYRKSMNGIPTRRFPSNLIRELMVKAKEENAIKTAI